MSERRIEMVWEDLSRSGSSGPVLHSSSHGYAEMQRNIAEGKGREGGKKQRDCFGPYVYGTSPKIAHYALRIEVCLF